MGACLFRERSAAGPEEEANLREGAQGCGELSHALGKLHELVTSQPLTVAADAFHVRDIGELQQVLTSHGVNWKEWVDEGEEEELVLPGKPTRRLSRRSRDGRDRGYSVESSHCGSEANAPTDGASELGGRRLWDLWEDVQGGWCELVLQEERLVKRVHVLQAALCFGGKVLLERVQADSPATYFTTPVQRVRAGLGGEGNWQEALQVLAVEQLGLETEDFHAPSRGNVPYDVGVPGLRVLPDTYTRLVSDKLVPSVSYPGLHTTTVSHSVMARCKPVPFCSNFVTWSDVMETSSATEQGAMRQWELFNLPFWRPQSSGTVFVVDEVVTLADSNSSTVAQIDPLMQVPKHLEQVAEAYSMAYLSGALDQSVEHDECDNLCEITRTASWLNEHVYYNIAVPPSDGDASAARA
mmetsp:Transcript_7657/g.26958  ORF Transcript_7657/g.26958 Transcript_7657/m.26958 type:complete len:411 (-) Transcript_7657:224-1456(-)